MAQRIFISVINDLQADQRIHRIASTIQQAGYEVLVIGLRHKNTPILPTRPYSTYRIPMWFRRGKGFYLEFNLRLLLFLLRKRPQLLNANDLDTLLANYLASRWNKIPLVYDSHEYFTELPELIHRPRTRSIWLLLERFIFPKLSHVYTVNDSLAQAYQDRYQGTVSVIRNLPFHRAPLPPAQRNAFPPFRLLYQGSLNVGRGLELMIEAMQYLPDCELYLIGRGDKEIALRQLTQRQPHPERIIFEGFIPFEQLHTHTDQAHLGLSLEEDLGSNYRFASPNKVYDYIQAHVPVLVSDLPEMRRLVESHEIGEVLAKAERNPQGLANKIKQILMDTKTYQQYRIKCQQAAQRLCWEEEKEKLLMIYQAASPSS